MAFVLELDGSSITSEAAFHNAVMEASGYEGYGHNRDALWDLLSGLVERPVTIRWFNAGKSAAAMGEDFVAIVTIIIEAAVAFPDDAFAFELKNQR